MKLYMVYRNLPLYRTAIFREIGNAFDVTWAFSGTKDDVKDADPNEFKGDKIHLRYRKIVGNLFWQHGQVALAFRRDVDAFIVSGDIYNLSLYVMAFLARLRGKKVYFWSIGWRGKYGRLKRTLSRVFWSLPTMGLIYGQRSTKMMRDARLGCNNYVTIFNSLEYDKHLQIRKDLKPSDIYARHFGNDNPVVLFIGRLIPTKRLDMLIHLVARLKNSDTPVNAVLIGTGAELEKLETMAKQEGIEENVWFYGSCYDEVTNAELIFNADLCLSPRQVGLTATHALTFGLPCASSDDLNNQGPESEGIIPGVTGFFFKAGSMDDLEMKTREWLNYARGKREEIRRACHDEVEAHWNPHVQMKILHNILDPLEKKTQNIS